jgi:hypothetical protein
MQSSSRWETENGANAKQNGQQMQKLLRQFIHLPTGFVGSTWNRNGDCFPVLLLAEAFNALL